MFTSASTASRIDYGVNRVGNRQLRRQWTPSGVPKAVILLIHGISEHSGRYERVGAQLAAAGFGVVAIDQRGHGRTEGRKGHIDTFTEFHDDVEDQLAELRTVGVPVVLLGHSMGGLVCTSYCITGRPRPDLLVLSGPALGVGIPKWQIVAAQKLSQLAPTFYPKVPFDTAVLSRDPAVGEAYRADPDIEPGGSVNLANELIETATATAARVRDELTLPTLCLHGGDDELVPTEASAVLDGMVNVERRVLDGLRHEIFNEPEGPEVVAQVIAWLDRQIAQIAQIA